MNDQLDRQLRILQRLQHSRASNSVTVDQIKNFLADQGIVVSTRTIQRDMNALSTVFDDMESLKKEEGCLGWFWNENARAIYLSGFSLSQALSFKLVKKYLMPLLPEATLKDLYPFFEKAEDALNSLEGDQIMQWPDKIAIVHPTQRLLPPSIDKACQITINSALLENHQLELTYVNVEGTQKSYLINPLGLVLRGEFTYLIATSANQNTPTQFAMHRIKAAKPLDTVAIRPTDFDLNQYIETGNMGFSWSTDIQMIELKVIVGEGSARHLREARLSEDQTITEYSPGYVLLTATVHCNDQLIWWIRSYGPAMQVLEPVELRNRLKAESIQTAEAYAI